MSGVIMVVALLAVLARPQYYKSELKPPPPAMPAGHGAASDSLSLHSPVSPTIPVTAEDYLKTREYAADLRDPSNIKTEAVFDPTSGMYVLRTTVGDRVII